MLYMMENRNNSEVEAYVENAVGKRPEYELFDIRNDPGCTKNLIDEPELAEIKGQLIQTLMEYLKETEDPRVDPGRQHEFESHRRYAGIREFPPADWTKELAESEVNEIKEWADKDTEPRVAPVAIGDWGVQTDRWKLVREDGRWKLFDIVADPDAREDVSSTKSRTTGNLVKYYDYWRNQ
jgi:hypothetical protein